MASVEKVQQEAKDLSEAGREDDTAPRAIPIEALEEVAAAGEDTPVRLEHQTPHVQGGVAVLAPLPLLVELLQNPYTVLDEGAVHGPSEREKGSSDPMTSPTEG